MSYKVTGLLRVTPTIDYSPSIMQTGQSLEPLPVTNSQVDARSWLPLADLVHAAGPVLSVAQLALPAPVNGGTSADDAAAAHPSSGPYAADGPVRPLRLAFSGATSGDIAVWDLTGERPALGGRHVPVSPVLYDKDPSAVPSAPFQARMTRSIRVQMLLAIAATQCAPVLQGLEIRVSTGSTIFGDVRPEGLEQMLSTGDPHDHPNACACRLRGMASHSRRPVSAASRPPQSFTERTSRA